MRILLSGLLVAAGLGAGCVHKKAETPQANFSAISEEGAPAAEIPPSKKQPLIVTPEHALIEKVVSVNATSRFVVLSFPLGRLPAVDLPLNVYRRGLKVGNAKVTGHQLNEYVVADLLEGEAEVGDEVRDR